MKSVKIAAALLALTFAQVGLGKTVFAKDVSTFVYASPGEPTLLDPARANGNWEFTVTRNIYDRLVNYDLADPSRLEPGLALEWAADGNDWTFKLRQGVKFHDGKPFDATDVKATLDRLLKYKLGQSYLVAEIKEVTVVDPHTVRISTHNPNVYLPGNLAKIEMVSAADVAAHDKPDDSFFAQGGNGTGPYKFVSWKRGVQIELARNPDWWGAFPKKPFERIVIRFIEEGANRARGVEGGEFHSARRCAAARQQARLQADRRRQPLGLARDLSEHAQGAHRQRRLPRGLGQGVRLRGDAVLLSGKGDDAARTGSRLVSAEPGKGGSGNQDEPGSGQGGAQELRPERAAHDLRDPRRFS